ncbi:MAG: threonine synthase, partial [Polaribacter sp.]
MNYYSLHHKSPISTFKNAVVQGLAKDRGIYFPASIMPLSKEFIANITKYTHHEIAYEVIKQFVGDEIPTEKLKEIIEE